MTTTWPAAAIAVVNYNTPEQVPGCLAALRALDYPQIEILCVDNAAGGGRPVDLGAGDSGVRVLRPATNLGFGGAANLAWRQARGDLLAVVNPDVRVRRDWLRALAAGLQAHAGARAAIAGGKLLYPDGRVQHAGGTFSFPEAATAHIGRGAPDSVASNHDREMAFVTGAALAITRAAADAVGGFDAGFWPVYFEDVDLCARAWAAGYSVWYIPAAVAEHAESASLAHGGADYFRYYQRNRLRYVLKHYPRARVLGEFAPAEEARLRGDLAPEDRASSLALYADPTALAALLAPPAATDPPPLATRPPTTMDLPTVDVQNADQGTPHSKLKIQNSKFAAPLERRQRLRTAVAEAQAGWRVQAQPFRSRVPGLAGLRTRLNNLWTRWYVDPIVAQQVEYNATLARAVRELADQVAGLEAALLVRTALEQVTADAALLAARDQVLGDHC